VGEEPFVLAPLVFAHRLTISMLERAAPAFAPFCATAASTCSLTTPRDREQDRLHPLKSRCPIASLLRTQRLPSRWRWAQAR
jgi:4-hydroxybenzoate polyprenyltransferase